MAFTKMDPQPAGLNPGEVAVTLDDTTHAAAICTVDGAMMVTAYARVINNDGSAYKDFLGHAVTTAYSVQATPALQASCGSLAKLQTLALMVVLGESFAPLPVDAASAERLSIKAKLAAIKALEQPDTASLLG